MCKFPVKVINYHLLLWSLLHLLQHRIQINNVLTHLWCTLDCMENWNMKLKVEGKSALVCGSWAGSNSGDGDMLKDILISQLPLSLRWETCRVFCLTAQNQNKSFRCSQLPGTGRYSFKRCFFLLNMLFSKQSHDFYYCIFNRRQTKSYLTSWKGYHWA